MSVISVAAPGSGGSCASRIFSGNVWPEKDGLFYWVPAEILHLLPLHLLQLSVGSKELALLRRKSPLIRLCFFPFHL